MNFKALFTLIRTTFEEWHADNAAQIFFLGAEFTQVYAKTHGSLRTLPLTTTTSEAVRAREGLREVKA